MFAHGPHRSRHIGFVGGLPLAAGAYATTLALFGSHVGPEFRFVDAGPLRPLGAASSTRSHAASGRIR